MSASKLRFPHLGLAGTKLIAVLRGASREHHKAIDCQLGCSACQLPQFWTDSESARFAEVSFTFLCLLLQVETLANGQAVTQRPLECYPVPDSDLNLEQLQKPSGTFQICSAQGQRESDRFPQALHGRMVTRYA